MQEYVEYLQVILLSSLIGVIFLWVAKSYGYFRILHDQEPQLNPVRFKTVAVVFLIYLGLTMVLAPVIAKIIEVFIPPSPTGSARATAMSILQLLILACIFVLFYLYCKTQDNKLFRWIWKHRSNSHPSLISVDFMMGILSWFISFPLVIAIGQLTDMILYLFFGFENYEQVAVRYLKTTFGSPSLLVVAVFTIVIAAPIIEEFLFRGCLQTFLKRHMASKYAIVLSAACFSLFHFAPSQGIGNISLVASLFILALFLGFIYERQASLFASVGLHMTFNAVSTFRILLFPE